MKSLMTHYNPVCFTLRLMPFFFCFCPVNLTWYTREMCTVSSVYDEVTITNKRSLRAALKQQRAIPAGTQEHILQ